MKVLINKCCGGFGLNQEVYRWLIKNKGWTIGKGKNQLSCDCSDLRLNISKNDLSFRSNGDVIEAVEALGLDKAADVCSKLLIVDVPDEYKLSNLEVVEHDGYETLQTIPVRFG